MDNKKIGEFICELRKEKHLTQYDLAEKIPVTRESVSKWERGINKPDKSCVQSLCKIFDVTSDEILLGRRNVNKNDIETLALNLYEDRNKKQMLIKLSFIIIILISLLFLVYYFIENYNSIHIYTINYSDDNITLSNGIFAITKEKMYFYLGNIVSNKDIKSIKMYYKDKNKVDNLIYETDDTNIILYDFYGYDNYFSSKNLNYVLKNTYLDIIYDNDRNTIKIDFIKDFSNNKVFNNKNINVSNDNHLNNKINVDKIKEKLILENNMYTYSKDEFYITYSEEANLINLILTDNEVNKEWNYYIDLDILSYNEYNKKKVINSFTSKNNNIECLTDKCYNAKEIIDYFFEKINEL